MEELPPRICFPAKSKCEVYCRRGETGGVPPAYGHGSEFFLLENGYKKFPRYPTRHRRSIEISLFFHLVRFLHPSIQHKTDHALCNTRRLVENNKGDRERKHFAKPFITKSQGTHRTAGKSEKRKAKKLKPEEKAHTQPSDTTE